ncbi:MAG TPA: peptide chain release factor N(5)-glutamine methyltransferase [Acidimicrobiales bacterium]
MTDAKSTLIAELVSTGLEGREARWLVEEFVPEGDCAANAALLVAAERRRRGEPLQYIIGHWPFRTLDLDVDDRALIPRPETEELVDVALRELARRAPLNPLVVDLGTGSGAIGLSLLCELDARGITANVIGLDESEDALALARQNARKHGALTASFLHSSWFGSLDSSLRGRVDLIVANPPYVDDAEFFNLDPVLHYEPRGALVAESAHGIGGFGDLEIVIGESIEWLVEDGVLVCEHGDVQREAVLGAARVAGYREIADLDDAAGRPRVLVARR